MRVSPQPPSPPTVVRASLKPPSPLAAARCLSILPHRRPRAPPPPTTSRPSPSSFLTCGTTPPPVGHPPGSYFARGGRAPLPSYMRGAAPSNSWCRARAPWTSPAPSPGVASMKVAGATLTLRSRVCA